MLLFLYFQDSGLDSDEKRYLTRNSGLEQDPLGDVEDGIIVDDPENQDDEEEEDRDANTTNNPPFPNLRNASSISLKNLRRETPHRVLRDLTKASNIQCPGQRNGNLNERIKRR